MQAKWSMFVTHVKVPKKKALPLQFQYLINWAQSPSYYYTTLHANVTRPDQTTISI